jgi:hypothetical protein
MKGHRSMRAVPVRKPKKRPEERLQPLRWQNRSFGILILHSSQ